MTAPRDNAELWTRARARFLELAESDPAAREAALGRFGAEDAELAAYVRRLLEQDRALESQRARATPVERIGPFTILEKIGEGGFGTVYRARQEAPIVREVALKIQKAGLDSPQLVARFADERRYLARIDHPDVVKVLDAGATEDGRLYVAMELVRGEPITEFVARERLPLAERVALVARIARAVNHVHQRAILHRDLKPTNILVARADGELRLCIIDFGIATALSNAERAGWTRLGGPICTPGYAAPEQMAGSEDIDVRADVHALGCVLSECLTGHLPREPARSAETPARRPSAIAKSQEGTRHLSRALRGDLDRIVLKAVAWDPEERYASAAALAEDLERYLRCEPVHAAPPTWWYVARKFARRNKLAVALTSAALGAVAVASWFALDGHRRAVLEREAALVARDDAAKAAERAQRVTTYLLEDMVQRFDIDARPARPMTVDELLAAAESDALERFAGEPAVGAAILSIVGRSHAKSGRTEEALEALRKAIDAASAAHGVPSREVFDLRLQVLDVLVTAGRSGQREVLALAQAEANALFLPGDRNLLRLRQRSNPQADELEAIVTTYEQDPGTNPYDYFVALRLLSEMRRMALQYDREFAALEKLRASALERLGADHSTTIDVTGALARALGRTPRVDEALELYADAHDRAQRVLGGDNKTARIIARNYAELLGRAGRASEGLCLALDECERTRRLEGEGSIPHTASLGYLGRLHALTGQLVEAEAVQRLVLALRQAQWSPKHTMRVIALQELAETLILGGRHEEALALADDAFARTEHGSWRSLQVALVRARASAGLDRMAAARDLLDEAIAASTAAGLPEGDIAPARELRASFGP